VAAQRGGCPVDETLIMAGRWIKLLFVGDSGVGKTCLLLRYVNNTFSSTFITTIGVDFKRKTVGELQLQLWDTAGQERFRTITTSYFRGAMGIVVVYDVTDRQSFESVRGWHRMIQAHAADGVDVILLGNKVDRGERRVTEAEGAALAEELGMAAFGEVSAKTAVRVDAMFDELARRVWERLSAGGASGASVLALQDALDAAVRATDGGARARDEALARVEALVSKRRAPPKKASGPFSCFRKMSKVAPIPTEPLEVGRWPKECVEAWTKLALHPDLHFLDLACDAEKLVPPLKSIVEKHDSESKATSALASAVERAHVKGALALAAAGACNATDGNLKGALNEAIVSAKHEEVCERLIAVEPRILSMLPYDILPRRRYLAWLEKLGERVAGEPPETTVSYDFEAFVPPMDRLGRSLIADAAAALECVLTEKKEWREPERRLVRSMVVEPLRNFYEAAIADAKANRGPVERLYAEVLGKHEDVYLDQLHQIRQEASYDDLVNRSEAMAASLAGADHTQPKDLVTDAVDVVRHALPLAPQFTEFMRDVSKRTGAQYIGAPRKRLMRIVEKIALDTKDPWDASRVVDVVRCSFICDSFAIMVAVLRLLQDCDEDLRVAGRSTGGMEQKLHIKRVKPRFSKPLSSGYADILINLAMDDSGYVCEVQLAHAQLFRARRYMGGHEDYAKFRAAADLHSIVFGDEAPAPQAPVARAVVEAPADESASSKEIPLLARPPDVAALVAKEVSERLPALVEAEITRRLPALVSAEVAAQLGTAQVKDNV
jgi:Ras-related protein Rab-8A